MKTSILMRAQLTCLAIPPGRLRAGTAKVDTTYPVGEAPGLQTVAAGVSAIRELTGAGGN